MWRNFEHPELVEKEYTLLCFHEDGGYIADPFQGVGDGGP